MNADNVCDHCKQPLLNHHNEDEPLPDGWEFAWQTVEGPITISDYQTICYPCAVLYDQMMRDFFPNCKVL